MISNFNKNIESKIKQRGVNIKILKEIQFMIDSLSKLEEDITAKYKTLGLNKNDKQII